jgi:putative ABC transport system permease protein
MTIWHDARHAVRSLLTHPGYLATAVLTLAVAIGCSTATFSVLHGVLLRPLPYQQPDRLVRLMERNLPRFPQFSVSPGHFLFWREHARAFEAMGAWTAQSVNLDAGDGEPVRVRADRVSAGLFPLLGVHPHIGRGLEPADEAGEQARVALLSYDAWQRRFGGSQTVLGTTVRVDREPVTIVGVMPRGFEFPSAGNEMWVPMVLSAAERRAYGSHFLSAVGRLAPGVTLEQAAADMGEVSRRLAEHHPESAGWEVLLYDMQDHAVRDLRQPLYVLFGAVALVLLIACANVANLLLARGASRQRELAIRSAIGATRGRLVRYLLIEQALLAGTSALAGVLIAAWLLRLMLALAPSVFPVHASIELDRQVLAFAVGLGLLTPLVFGLLPAFHASRVEMRSLMAGGTRQGGSAPARRTREALVVVEIALAMTLLVGAGLLIRSFATLVSQSPGFVSERAILAGVSLPPETYEAGEPRERFLATFLERVTALPSVAAAGLAMPMPMVSDFNSGYEIEGEPSPDGQHPLTLFYAVSPGYLQAMQIPLLRGRFLTDDDRSGGRRVIVINQAIADRHFAGGDPIGHRIRVGQGPFDWREIVGVVGNVKQQGLDEAPRPQVYESFRQHPYFSTFSLVVRAHHADPARVVPDVRSVLRGMDPELPLAGVRTLDQLVDSSVRPQRFSTMLIGTFGVVALLLAAVGLYGVLAYLVGQRRQELAIRVAHGATTSDILRLVVANGLTLAAAGVGLGLAGAALLRRLLEGMLYGVSAADPVAYAIAAAVLTTAALAASLIPAWRAARVDPLTALRAD